MIDENNDELKIGELPRLQIIDIEQIVFHEEPDIERVARLVEKLGADGVLKNPPVVARYGDSARCILLDGANRVTALRKLDFQHVLVQEIDLEDPGLILATWHHAIEHLTRETLLGFAAAVSGVRLADTDVVADDPGYLCRLRFADQSEVALVGSSDLFEKVSQLKSFVGSYHRFEYMDRVSYTNLEHLKRNYRGFSALVSFPRFRREDLLAITRAGLLLPSGVTRVLLPKRALRFNLHLDILRAKLSVEEKNLWLRDTIQQKIQDKCIRFYREPTFFFDE
ncbi:MAG: hypothetical protein ONB23_10865 [candidate division KSB1 bacterium]|nr:hypothetical protein [candidate division KSB1 bacterium]